MSAGLVLGLGASVCWAMANVAIQRSARAVGVLPALVWAQLVGGAGLVVASLMLDRHDVSWTAGMVAWAGVGGIAACLAYLGLFYATARGGLSTVIPIVSSWALLSTGIGVALLGQAVGLMTLVGAALVVAGVMLVARATGDGGAAGGRAVVAALGGAIGFGTVVPAIDRIAPAAGRLGAVALVFAIDLVLILPFAPGSLRAPRRPAWGPLVAAGLCEALGFACASLGAARAPMAVVAPAASLSAPITVAWAWLVLGERPGGLAFSGAALSAVGVILLAS